MSEYEKKKIDVELRAFTSKNFEKPTDCKNIEQIKFYVKELCLTIEQHERKYNYVPNWVYGLLAQYNDKQNKMVAAEFRSAYY